MRVREKLREIEPLIAYMKLDVERRSPGRAVLRGVITFTNHSRLHLLEYLVEENMTLSRISYRFHYVDESGVLIFRYDNAPHHPELPTFPHHKHLPSGEVAPSGEKSLIEVLDEIKHIILNK